MNDITNLRDRRVPPQPPRAVTMPPASPSPPAPAMPPPRHAYSVDAEREIRHRVEEHFNLLAQIGILETDVAVWRQRAELAEAEIVVLVRKLKDAETRGDELKDTISTLRAQFETGAKVWLSAYDALKKLDHPLVQVTTPNELKLTEHVELENEFAS